MARYVVRIRRLGATAVPQEPDPDPGEPVGGAVSGVITALNPASNRMQIDGVWYPYDSNDAFEVNFASATLDEFEDALYVGLGITGEYVPEPDIAVNDFVFALPLTANADEVNGLTVTKVGDGDIAFAEAGWGQALDVTAEDYALDVTLASPVDFTDGYTVFIRAQGVDVDGGSLIEADTGAGPYLAWTGSSLFAGHNDGVDWREYEHEGGALDGDPHDYVVKWSPATETITYMVDGTIVGTVDNITAGPDGLVDTFRILHSDASIASSANVPAVLGGHARVYARELDDSEIAQVRADIPPSPVVYGPRVIPGVAGASSNPDMGLLTEVRLSEDNSPYENYEVPAGSFVLPEEGDSVTLEGWIFEDDGVGSVLYGLTLDAAGEQYSAEFFDAGNVTIEHCDIVGDPQNDAIRVNQPNIHLKACRWTGDPGNHGVLFFTDGSGSVQDCEFDGNPAEDHIQCADFGDGGVLISHCRFTSASGEDAVDTKPAHAQGKVTVEWCDFTTDGMTSEAVLSLNFGDVIRNCRFGAGTIISIGTHQVEDVWAVLDGCIFLPGSTLRLRQGDGSEIKNCTFTGATIQLGTQDSPGDDFPENAYFHDNVFNNVTIDVNNANSTTITENNTYEGTTTGTFPSGNN